MAGQSGDTPGGAVRFDRETLLDAARQRTGLSDFGDTWFFEPMDRFIEAAHAEARLTPPQRLRRRNSSHEMPSRANGGIA